MYPGDDFNFFPETFLIPEHTDALKKHMKKSGKTHIVKPAEGSEGCGICLVKDFNKIPKVSFNSDHIVQEYRDDPILINGKKFDLRIYVLIRDW